LFHLNPRFLAATLVLLGGLVAIAMYVHDGFVRTFVGDALVVVFMYAAIRTLWAIDDTRLVIALVGFSWLVEVGQYLQLVEILGLGHHPLARTVIGTTFAWMDLLAYTLGGAAILGCSHLRARVNRRGRTH